MLKKKGMIEFSWIFALIVGAVILFLAFYFIGTKFTEKEVLSSVQTEQSLDIIFNPFSSFGSLGATSSKVIELKKPEKFNFSCNSNNLGYNGILVSTEVSVKPRLVYDKYLFTENFSQGKNFQIISKPFSMPWRVADLIYFFSKDDFYCFVGFSDAEEEFGDSGTGLNISNFQFESPCPSPSVVICNCNGCNQQKSGCNITVDFLDNVVIKSSGRSFFVDDATMYAAILSDPYIYNCNLKRLAKRIVYQTEVYMGKSSAVSSRCSVGFNLGSLKYDAEGLYSARNPGKTRDNLANLKSSADILKNQNMWAECKLF